MKISADRMARSLFVFSVCFFVFGYGVAVGVYRVFPFQILRDAKRAFEAGGGDGVFFRPANHAQKVAVQASEGAFPGLNLVTSIIADRRLSAKIIGMDGELVHEWKIDWFELWPDDDTGHIPPDRIPRALPGTEIHGAVVMDNGDLVFCFYNLGLMRLNTAGEVVWRVPYRIHHSVDWNDKNGRLWVSGLKTRDQTNPEYPNYHAPFEEYTVVELTQDGEILQEISVFELLKQNQLHGLLYLASIEDRSTETGGDTLHLNDVEVFPANLEPGFFDHDDVMISLRNINTVLVFHRETHKVKYVCTGKFVRQHDPDFIDSRTISVFDNNNVGDYNSGIQSRIVSIDTPTNKLTVEFEGNEDVPFFTDIKGKHQWLPNGNLLVTESMQGRAFELNPEGNVVWEYINYVAPGRVGSVTEVTRLPLSYADFYTKEAADK